jgi:uncharacterized low-complexity protein
MKDKILLTIAVASLVSLGSMAAAANDAPAAPAQPAKATASHGGKCASGKCGTEKIYSKAKLDHDPNGALVRARDGKCGLSGKGYQVEQSPRDKLAEGVCGH